MPPTQETHKLVGCVGAIGGAKEYLMYNRGPGFLAVVLFGFSPFPVSKHYAGDTQEGEGAKSYDGEKACSSIIHFIYRRPTLYPLEIAVDFLKSL